MDAVAETPEPPYYAVVFTSRRTSLDDGYADTAGRMLELAARQPGFLGVESAREGAFGITVSYWRDTASIRCWKADLEHLDAQRQGRERWYRGYVTRVARVERDYAFPAMPGEPPATGDRHLADRQRHSWEANAPAWTRAVREGHIASRRITDGAIVTAVTGLAPRRVLDLGCGEGWLSRELAARHIDVVGIDASPALIEAARAQGGGDFHVLDYASLAQCRGDPPRWLGEGFDVVVANFALLDEAIEPLLRRLGTWLTPPGRLCIQTLHPWGACASEAYRSGWRRETFQAFGDDFPASMPWFFRTLGDWLHLLADAGLALEAVEEPRDPDTGEPVSLLLRCHPRRG